MSLVNNLQVVPEPHEESRSDIKIDYKHEVSSVVYDYILVGDREHRLTHPPEIYVYEDLVAYALLTSYGDDYLSSCNFMKHFLMFLVVLVGFFFILVGIWSIVV